MRSRRFALVSRRRGVCASRRLVPLARVPASNAAATHFTLVLTLILKPNINDYSCTRCALLLWNSGRAARKSAAAPLIRTSAALKRWRRACKERIRMAKKSGGGGFGKLFLGFLLGIAAVAAAGLLYIRFGSLPVAVADAPFPMERQIVKVPEKARIDREMKTPPFGISEDVFEAGAHIYQAQCASCHGTPGHDVAHAKYMYPRAPQLWKKHARGNVVGVSDDE